MSVINYAFITANAGTWFRQKVEEHIHQLQYSKQVNLMYVHDIKPERPSIGKTLGTRFFEGFKSSKILVPSILVV